MFNKVHVKQIRRTIELSSQDESRCLKTHKTKDTFVSTGTYINPLNNTIVVKKDVVLLSHGMVQKFNVETQKSTMIYEGKNLRFRGMYSTDDRYVYLITPNLKEESQFLEIGKDGEKNVVAKETWDGHDMVKYGDIVYVVSTGNGCLQVYDIHTYDLKRSHKIASKDDHINTLAVSSSTVYVMYHYRNSRPSDIKVFDRFSFDLIKTYSNVGRSAHGLSVWNNYIVSLDSMGGSVVLIDDDIRRIWTCDHCFLKGLTVVQDQVCFGRSPPQKRIHRLSVNTNVVCVDLLSGNTIYDKPMITKGLLNHLVGPGVLDIWDYELMPIKYKRKQNTKYKMLGPIDIYDTRKFFIKHWKSIWGPFEFPSVFTHRSIELFKNVVHSRLLFSFRKNKKEFVFGSQINSDTSIEMPTSWDLLKPVVVPMLDSLFARLGIDNWEERILRLQFNLIPKDAEVKPHIDIGFYSVNAHRIHIPIFSSKCIVFSQEKDGEWQEVPFKEGEAFEINNKIRHRVEQHGPYNRVTMIIDYMDRKCSSFVQLEKNLIDGDIKETLDIHEWRGEL